MFATQASIQLKILLKFDMEISVSFLSSQLDQALLEVPTLIISVLFVHGSFSKQVNLTGYNKQPDTSKFFKNQKNNKIDSNEKKYLLILKTNYFKNIVKGIKKTIIKVGLLINIKADINNV